MVPGARGPLGNMTRHGYKHFVQKFFSPRCSKQFLIAMPCRTSHVPYKSRNKSLCKFWLNFTLPRVFSRIITYLPPLTPQKLKNFNKS